MMSRRLVVLVSIGAVSALAAFAGACGGSDDNINLDSGNDATTGNDTGTTADTGTGTDTGTGSDASDAAITDAGSPCVGSDAGCLACCGALYPDAAPFIAADIVTCACTNPGDCKNSCAGGNNLCSGHQPNGNCKACLADPDAGGCVDKARSDCLSDPSCKAFALCAASCGDGG